MSKSLLVFGATGQQGGSVIQAVLNDPTLFKQYAITGVTRNTSSASAQTLKDKGIKLMEADVNDGASLAHALQEVHTVFINTITVYDADTKARELSQGIAIANAAVAAHVSYIIYSTLPHPGRISANANQQVAQFEAKAEVEDHIRSLPVPSAFFAPGSFMQNFASNMAPFPAGDGTYALSNCVTPTTRLPLIDIAADTGKFVAAILADPDKYKGEVLCAATDTYSMDEITAAMSAATGKKIVYNQLPDTVFGGFLPPESAVMLVGMFKHFQDYGYYGSETEAKVKWAAEQAHGHLTTLEEYFEKAPLQLY